MSDTVCTCGRLAIGSEITEARNWNPDCHVHGLTSHWYRSPEEVEKRRADSERLRDLQRRASEAKRKARGSD